MILRAHQCRARASEARELARQTKRAATKAALEQAAEYWSGLAERVEQREQRHPGRTAFHVPIPTQTHKDPMPVVGYLVSVGIGLFLGLLVVSEQFVSGVPDAAAISAAQTNAAIFLAKP
jgi:hypothetical protein